MSKKAFDLGYQIEDWAVFLNDDSHLGRANELKLPDLIKKTEDHSAGGALGELAVSVGAYQKMEFEIVLNDVSSKVKTLVSSKNKIEQLMFNNGHSRLL